MTGVSSGLIFLAAAVVAVPVFKKLKLGAILGYLVAGLVIGPSVLNLIDDPTTILHFAEFGVVLLLFIIGLELEPQKLWRLRNQILLTGGSQLLVTTALIGLGVLAFLPFSLSVSLVIGLALALSSTAFAIQLMTEQRVLKTAPGQGGFAILLMQDLAVIPILLLIEALSVSHDAAGPAWWVSVLAIIAVIAVGVFLINPFLRLVSRYGSAEVMTAAALLIVLATAMGMQASGLTMGMGAFIAGMLLANSSFRHQLETEIEPFKGLLLGLFFIAIGMTLDLNLLVTEPVFILSSAIVLVALKAWVIYAIMRVNKQCGTDAMRVALMLSQGGEFAFVVMAQAATNGILSQVVADQVTLIVGISMALTSPVVILHSIWFNSNNCPPVYDTHIDTDEPQVLIAGFGRFGQITARILSANNIAFSALDKNAEHIEFVKRFGNKVFFGDASRLDLLKTAGIEQASILLIAVDVEDEALKIAEMVAHHFPHIRIVARAHNRMSVREFAKLGVHNVIRESFAGSLEAAEQVLTEYGFSHAEAENMSHIFEHHDREILQRSIDEELDMDGLIARNKANRQQLESLFRQDKLENS